MARFKQAAPDPEKAARDGVANYVPARRQINLDHGCERADCVRTASWLVKVDGRARYACHACREDEAATARGVYTEKRL